MPSLSDDRRREKPPRSACAGRGDGSTGRDDETRPRRCEPYRRAAQGACAVARGGAERWSRVRDYRAAPEHGRDTADRPPRSSSISPLVVGRSHMPSGQRLNHGDGNDLNGGAGGWGSISSLKSPAPRGGGAVVRKRPRVGGRGVILCYYCRSVEDGVV